MQLTVVGSSPAWQNPGGIQSGYLVEGPGRLLLDCGPGVFPQLRAASGGSWPDVDAIVVTHWHLDHWGDLVPWTWGRLVAPGAPTTAPELWVPPGGADELEGFAVRYGVGGMFEQAFSVREYTPSETFVAAGFEVTAVAVEHYGMPTHGMRVVAAGRTLAYSADTCPCAALVALARDADLFLCEATLEDGAVDGDPRGHLSAEEALAAFAAAGATRLLLTHRPVELPLPPGIEQAVDGMVVRVAAPG